MFAVYRTRRSWLLIQLLAVAVMGFPGPASGQAEQDAARFEKEILPIFRRHCSSCHAVKPQRAGLNLSSAAGLLAGSDTGPVIVNGSAEKSILFEKIADRSMPPAEKKNPLSHQQIAVIRKWLDDGAPGATGKAPMRVKKDVVTDEDRAHWGFRKPVASPVPQVRATERVRTPIDAFLLSQLEARGLTFSPDAAKATLLRRAYLDLIGLPPVQEEVQAFLDDTRQDAYERVLDRLLNSPHYGERWGRHWLDVAGYTDQPHYTADKAGKLVIFDDWLYRDYVVQAFNQDKPYDRFVTEQLAGDELVAWRTAAVFTPEIRECLIATGYLRTTPDWTHGDQFQDAYRIDALSRVVDNFSTGILGLTMGCVRCHGHKFEPIPHEDYYRLMAVFATAYNPEDWLRPVDRYLADMAPREKAKLDRHNTKIEARLMEIAKELEDIRRPHRKKVLAAKLAKLPEAIRTDVEKALATPAPMRTEVQGYLASKFESLLKVSDQEIKLSPAEIATTARLSNEKAALPKQRRSFTRLQVLWDIGKPPALRHLIRGDVRTPGQVVEAGFPTVLCPPGKSAVVRPQDLKLSSSGRRLGLARWLTSPDHPLTARVLVNRAWQHHFGIGLVASPENFGRSGTPPTHPELLDWLAVDFVQNGWSIKRLHRLLMTSTAYRQAAHRPRTSQALQIDPENTLLWRMNLRRLEAEVLRDAVLAVSGKLDRTLGGAPVPVISNPDGLVTVSDKGATPTSQWRRSIYLRSQRGSHPSGTGFRLSMLEVFDFPEVVINCTRRGNSTTPLQSLALINSKFMMEQARFFADRVAASSGKQASADKRVAVAFMLALGRAPTTAEAGFCRDYLNSQTDFYARLKSSPEQAAQRALASLCSILLASNEFLYNS